MRSISIYSCSRSYPCSYTLLSLLISLFSFYLNPVLSTPAYAEIQSETAFSPEMLFLNAIRAGEVKDIGVLIEKGLNPNQPFQNGITPIHIAVINNQEEALNFLLESGANPNISDKTTGATPLHFAALYGRTNLAELLIKHGASIDEPMKLGITPLLVAAQFKHARMVELLLDKKAKINTVDEEGFTALHFSAKNNDEITTKLLITRGAPINVKDRTHDATPLKIATENNAANVIPLLTSAGGEY